jgi:hypothetical protein
MAGRIVWIGIAGLALATGMVLQDGPKIWTLAAQSEITTKGERAIDAKIDAAIDRGIAKMEVTDSGGRAIDVAPETKRAMADAVGELVKAETDLALLKVRDGGDEEMQAAETRRDQARTQVETLKADIEKQREAAGTQDGAVRTQVRDEIRDEVREAVRDVARN